MKSIFFESCAFPYLFNIRLKILKQVDPALAGPLVYFHANLMQMRGREIPNQHKSENQNRNIESVFFGRIFVAQHWPFDRNSSCFVGG